MNSKQENCPLYRKHHNIINGIYTILRPKTWEEIPIIDDFDAEDDTGELVAMLNDLTVYHTEDFPELKKPSGKHNIQETIFIMVHKGKYYLVETQEDDFVKFATDISNLPWIKDLKRNFNYEREIWLDEITSENFKESFDIKRILNQSAFYPASGIDGSHIPVFTQWGIASFINVDYSVPRELVEQAMRQDFRGVGYELVGLRYVSEEEITPNGFRPKPNIPFNHHEMDRLSQLDFVRERMQAKDFSPFALWAVYELKDEGIANSNKRVKRFSLLHIGGEACASFDATYLANGLNPKAIAIIRPGEGYGDNWTLFTDPGFRLHTMLRMNCDNNGQQMPDFLLTSNTSLQEAFWPDYSFAGEEFADFGSLLYLFRRISIVMKENYLNILKDLVKIPSPSGMEEELARHIVNTYNVNDWEGQMDKVHNILFCPPGDNQSEKLPLLYAHLDTSKRSQPTDESLRHEDIIRLDEAGQVAKRDNVDIQMGFDDKAGVAAILYLMKHTELKFRALFVVQEEAGDEEQSYERFGGAGIDYVIDNHDANKSFKWVFKASSYVLSLDRANGFDLIEEYGEQGNEVRPKIRMCSVEFRDWVIKCSREVNHPLKIATGRIADIYNIRSKFPKLNCVNLSIGYYCEHNNCEYLKIDETLGVIKVLQKLLAGNPQG